jgi:hypothetical protein
LCGLRSEALSRFSLCRKRKIGVLRAGTGEWEVGLRCILLLNAFA